MANQAAQGATGPQDALRIYIREQAIRYPHVEYTEYLVSQTLQAIQPINPGITPDLARTAVDPLLTLSTALQRCSNVAEAREGVKETVELKRETKRVLMGVYRQLQEFRDGTFDRKQLQRRARDPLPLERQPQIPVLSRNAMRCTPRILSPAKDKNKRTPSQLGQLFKKGRFKISTEIPIGPYEDRHVTIEDALLLQREVDSDVVKQATEWRRSMTKARFAIAIEAKDAGVPASWQRMTESTKLQVESAPRPLSPCVLPRSLRERKRSNLVDMSFVGATYQKIKVDGMDGSELADLLNSAGDRDEDGGIPLSAFEGEDKRRAHTLFYPVTKSFTIVSVDHQGQLHQDATAWKTKKMDQLAHDLQPDMHVMSLSNMRATEVANQRDERVKQETLSATSTQRNGFLPRENRIMSPPSATDRHVASALRPVRQVVLIGPPDDLVTSTGGGHSSKRVTDQHELPHKAVRVMAGRHKLSPSPASTTTGSSFEPMEAKPPRIPTVSEQRKPPVPNIASQLANRTKAHHQSELLDAHKSGVAPTTSSRKDRFTPVPRVFVSATKEQATRVRNLESSQRGARRTAVRAGRSEAQLRPPTSYRNLSNMLKMETAVIASEARPTRLNLAQITLDSIAEAAGCATEPLTTVSTANIRNVLLPQDLAEDLLHPSLYTYSRPPSPNITAQVEFLPAKVQVATGPDVDAPAEQLSSAEKHPQVVKAFTYMPIPKASSSKLSPATTSAAASHPKKKQKINHVILQDSGSLDDIVKSRAKSLTPANGKPRETITDTLDGRLQLIGKADLVQKRITNKVQPLPARPELLDYAAAKPKSAVPPAPVKKMDWRDHHSLQNPPWYDKAIKSTPAPGDYKTTLLAAVALFRNRPLTSAFKAGGFDLLEHDLPGQGVDLVLSANTAMLFRSLKDIMTGLTGEFHNLKLATQYFQRTLLVVEIEAYGRQADQGVDTNPLSPAALKVLSNLQHTISSGLQDKPSGRIGKVEIVFAKRGAQEVVKTVASILVNECTALRRIIGDVEAAEVYGDRQWLQLDQDSPAKDAQRLFDSFKLNSFDVAYILLKASSVEQLLYHWTEGDRTVQFASVIGDKVIKRINEQLRPEPRKRRPVPPSPDEMNLRPPSS